MVCIKSAYAHVGQVVAAVYAERDSSEEHLVLRSEAIKYTCAGEDIVSIALRRQCCGMLPTLWNASNK